jgi:hypothetical protein
VCVDIGKSTEAPGGKTACVTSISHSLTCAGRHLVDEGLRSPARLLTAAICHVDSSVGVAHGLGGCSGRRVVTGRARGSLQPSAFAGARSATNNAVSLRASPQSARASARRRALTQQRANDRATKHVSRALPTAERSYLSQLRVCSHFVFASLLLKKKLKFLLKFYSIQMGIFT